MKIELTPTLWRHLLPLIIISALSSVVSAQTPDTVIPLSTVVDLPMRFRGPEPAVDVMVNGPGPFLFAIDTGATDEARIDSPLLGRLGLRVSAIGAVEFRRVKASTRDFNTVGLPHIDGLLTFDLFRDVLATIRLGKFEFPQPHVTFPTPFPFANIGSRILDQFAVTFDQKRHRIRFVRHNVDEELSANDRRFP